MSKELKVIEKGVNPIFAKAEDMKIETKEDMVGATEMLSQMNKYNDQIKEEKGKVLTPLLEATKAERGRWKPIEDKLKIGIENIRKVMTIYQTEQDKVAEEKKDKIAERVGKGKGKLKTETAVNQMENVEAPEEAVTTDSGMVKFRTKKIFTVSDLSNVPIEYHLLDEVKVRKAMKDGIELPGINYSEEKVPINYR